ncbi:MAG TPA: hypothetical protein VEO20_03290 [Thermoplasmata archaeon]|nr:hypothetical protein [Thermoplasmata archaeon]
MIPLPHRTLIATMGFDERHVLPALRLMPYDRLVVVAGPETFRSGGFRRLKGLEPSLRPVPVRAFDLLDSLATVRRTILDSAAKGPVRLSVAGGTKILTSAAILAAFLEGVEAWYCAPEPIRLPVLHGLRLTEVFSPSERTMVGLIRGPVSIERLVSTAGLRGMSRRTALAAIRSLVAKGLLEIEVRSGRSFVRPSDRFALFRPHVAAPPRKA